MIPALHTLSMDYFDVLIMSDKEKENRNPNKKKAAKYTCLSCNGTDTHWILICGKAGTSKICFVKYEHIAMKLIWTITLSF